MNYRLVYKVQDHYFDTALIPQYHLIYKIHSQSISFCIIDTLTNKCLFYKLYNYKEEETNISYIRLEEIIKSDLFLRSDKWKKVTCIVANTRFVFAPIDYINKTTALDYLRLNVSISKNEKILIEKNNKLTLSCAYLISKNLYQWFLKQYNTAQLQYTHSHIAFLKGLTSFIPESDIHVLYGKIQGSTLTLVIFNEGKLHFINTFSFYSTEDFIYFILFVIDEIGGRVSLSKLILWGKLDIDSELIMKSQHYIKHVFLGKKLSDIIFSESFDQLKINNDFDLFSAHLLKNE